MEPVTSRTDPRILRTRRLLRDAFVELLEEMEIDKISVNRIAERATINRVTFYLHFRDIPDMLEKMADDMAEDVKSALNPESAIGISPNEADWLKLENLLVHIADNAKFYKAIPASKRTPIFTERMLKLLKEMINDRQERIRSDSNLNLDGIPKDIALWYGSSALIGTIVSWLRHDMPYTPHFLAKQFFLISRGCSF